ncbi:MULTISPECIES: creatininase family protein [Brevibacterium]|uniref:Creatininase family protein n=1 Tax=Brevibacterium salitolerans TaxID=1403566 RepID=A0ABN2X330_9MICO|nr:creatininase family protein [Brevibacterium sp.]
MIDSSKSLGRLSWTEVAEAARRDPVVLLPIGAIEQHGPHLPVHEDSIVAEWAAYRIADLTDGEVDVLVAPALHYGHSPTFRGFAGNLSLSAETLKAAVRDIIDSLVRSGFRRIVLVDNNGGNVGPVSGAAIDSRRDLDVLIGHVYPWQLGYSLMRDVYEKPEVVYGHGAEPELSAMLAIFPEQVDLSKAESGGLSHESGWTPTSYSEAMIDGYSVPGTVYWDFSEVSENGVTGDVSAADAATGEEWIRRVMGFCAEYVREYDRNTARS